MRYFLLVFAFCVIIVMAMAGKRGSTSRRPHVVDVLLPPAGSPRSFSRRQVPQASRACRTVDIRAVLSAEPQHSAALTHFENNSQVHQSFSRVQQP